MQNRKTLQAIEKIAKGNKQTSKELMEIFTRQTALQTEQLQAYFKKNDWEEVKKIAHSLKSSFSYFNLTDETILATEIEKTAGANIEVTTKQVHQLVNKCLKKIDEFCAI